MSDQAAQTPLFVNSFSIYAGADIIKTQAATTALAAMSWGTASRAAYIPVWLPWPYVVRRVFWCNGSTVTSNVDFGVYTADGTQIYHTGNTAQSGASAIQYVTPGTEFMLASGVYYFAITWDGTTARAFGVASQAAFEVGGILLQTSAQPLPATATFAAGAAPLPLCGITRTASGF